MSPELKENLEKKQALFVVGIEAGLPDKIPENRKKLSAESFHLSIDIASVYLFGEKSQEDLSQIFHMSRSRIRQRVTGVLFNFYQHLPGEIRDRFKDHFPYYEWIRLRNKNP